MILGSALALLREREPVPQPALEGIPADRLTAAEAKPDTTPPAADGAGRVEFRVEARGD